MIRKAALLLISLFIACAASTTEPEFEGVFFAAGLSGELVTLERQPFTVQTRIKAIGFGGVRTAAEINSKKSPVRFSSNDKNAFVVRSANPTIDPATLYMLQSFTVSKSKRQLIQLNANGPLIYGNWVKNTSNQGVIPIAFEHLGESSFLITPLQPLPPGEYALAKRSGAIDIFCFGID